MHRKGAPLFCRFLFCLIVSKKFLGGDPCVSKLFWYGKKYGSDGGYHVLSSKNFCLRVPKKIVGEPFCILNVSDNVSFHA